MAKTYSLKETDEIIQKLPNKNSTLFQIMTRIGDSGGKLTFDGERVSIQGENIIVPFVRWNEIRDKREDRVYMMNGSNGQQLYLYYRSTDEFKEIFKSQSISCVGPNIVFLDSGKLNKENVYNNRDMTRYEQYNTTYNKKLERIFVECIADHGVQVLEFVVNDDSITFKKKYTVNIRNIIVKSYTANFSYDTAVYMKVTGPDNVIFDRNSFREWTLRPRNLFSNGDRKPKYIVGHISYNGYEYDSNGSGGRVKLKFMSNVIDKLFDNNVQRFEGYFYEENHRTIVFKWTDIENGEEKKYNTYLSHAGYGGEPQRRILYNDTEITVQPKDMYGKYNQNAFVNFTDNMVNRIKKNIIPGLKNSENIAIGKVVRHQHYIDMALDKICLVDTSNNTDIGAIYVTQVYDTFDVTNNHFVHVTPPLIDRVNTKSLHYRFIKCNYEYLPIKNGHTAGFYHLKGMLNPGDRAIREACRGIIKYPDSRLDRPIDITDGHTLIVKSDSYDVYCVKNKHRLVFYSRFYDGNERFVVLRHSPNSTQSKGVVFISLDYDECHLLELYTENNRPTLSISVGGGNIESLPRKTSTLLDVLDVFKNSDIKADKLKRLIDVTITRKQASLTFEYDDFSITHIALIVMYEDYYKERPEFLGLTERSKFNMGIIPYVKFPNYRTKISSMTYSEEE